MWEILSVLLSVLALGLLLRCSSSLSSGSSGSSSASVSASWQNWQHSKGKTAHYEKWKNELTNTMSVSPSMRSSLKPLKRTWIDDTGAGGRAVRPPQKDL